MRSPRLARIEANLTPMIDVTFLLIVFFVLVSQIVDVENVPMALPEPTDPLTERPGEEQRAVINVVPAADGDIRGYRLGTQTYAHDANGIEALTGQLRDLYSKNPQIAINVRADRATGYEHVEPVLEAISDAASQVPDASIVARVHLVVLRPENG